MSAGKTDSGCVFEVTLVCNEKESREDGLEIHRSPLFSSEEDSRINYVTATLEFIMKFLKP